MNYLRDTKRMDSHEFKIYPCDCARTEKIAKRTRYNLGRKIGKMKNFHGRIHYMNHLRQQKNILSGMLECSKNQKHQKC